MRDLEGADFTPAAMFGVDWERVGAEDSSAAAVAFYQMWSW